MEKGDQTTLAGYGIEPNEREPERVMLAIIKLCDADIDRLNSLVKEAKNDMRNVLLWAEKKTK